MKRSGLRTAAEWEERYQRDDAPWDNGRADPNLVAAVDDASRIPRACRVLEMGCGSGDDVVFLASRGFEVVGFDLSETALARAREKAAAAGVADSLDLRLGSFETLGDQRFDLAHDQGCFHTMPSEEASEAFAEAAASMLIDGGHWLSTCGSADGPPRDHGPPRLSLAELAAMVEPHFEVLSVTATSYDADLPSEARAWSVWMRKRTRYPEPAGESTQS